jgi:PKD repeat protein
LDGSSSSDPDGEIVSYLWEWQNGGAQSATGVSPAINLPVGTTTVTLTVTDDAGGTASDTVDITVTIPSYQVTFNLDGKGSRSGGGSLSQWIEASQDATAPSVSALDGWFFTGWDRDFTDITADITVMALYTTDFNNVAPDQDATVRTSRTAPPADAPPSSLEMGSLTVENGGSFELGASETLTLNSGPMTVSNGATIGGGGSIVGDLTLEPGSQFEFSPDSTLSVSGAVTMDPSFGVDDLGGLDASVPGGTYTLIDDTGTVFGLMGLENWGEENAYDLGGGKRAYFAEGSLMLVVTDASTSFSTWSGGASGDSDTNGDGIAALAAYALGAASPDENALQRLPTLETTGNEASYGLGFTDREDVTYTILISADLSTWYRVAHKPAGGPWELDTTDDATPVYQNVGSLGVIPSGDGIELNHADPPDGIFFSTEFEQPSTP